MLQDISTTSNYKKEKPISYLKEIEVRYKLKESHDEIIGKPLCSPASVEKLFDDLKYDTKEKLIVVNLDSNNQVMCYEVVAVGTLNHANARPAEVLRSALLINAASMILIHNHPSGEVKPSIPDITFTNKVREAAELMQVKLLDHIILGTSGHYSFARHEIGWK